MNKKPLGVFDSGVGGLTVVKEIFRQLPSEKIVYFGDTARVPYGNKSQQTVTRYATEIASLLISRHKVKALIVACNTASALALSELQKIFPSIPLFGVIRPASIKALDISKSKKIAVIGTEATVSSGAYPSTIRQINPQAQIFQKACPLLVPIVEEGRLNDTITRMVIRDYLKKILPLKPDALILGCTHYPLLMRPIKKIAGSNVSVVDSASAVVEEVKNYLLAHNLSAISSINKGYKEALYFVSDSPENFSKLARRFLKDKFNGNAKRVDLSVWSVNKTRK